MTGAVVGLVEGLERDKKHYQNKGRQLFFVNYLNPSVIFNSSEIITDKIVLPLLSGMNFLLLIMLLYIVQLAQIL